jgi:hypothetical protein
VARGAYFPLFMETSSDRRLAHLGRLADELTGRQFAVQLFSTARPPYLKVANPDHGELNERVLCQAAGDGSWCFAWPSRQPIGPAEDLPGVAGKIMTALRPVEGMQ